MPWCGVRGHLGESLPPSPPFRLAACPPASPPCSASNNRFQQPGPLLSDLRQCVQLGGCLSEFFFVFPFSERGSKALRVFLLFVVCLHAACLRCCLSKHVFAFPILRGWEMPLRINALCLDPWWAPFFRNETNYFMQVPVD